MSQVANIIFLLFVLGRPNLDILRDMNYSAQEIIESTEIKHILAACKKRNLPAVLFLQFYENNNYLDIYNKFYLHTYFI